MVCTCLEKKKWFFFFSFFQGRLKIKKVEVTLRTRRVPRRCPSTCDTRRSPQGTWTSWVSRYLPSSAHTPRRSTRDPKKNTKNSNSYIHIHFYNSLPNWSILISIDFCLCIKSLVGSYLPPPPPPQKKLYLSSSPWMQQLKECIFLLTFTEFFINSNI